ncbi:hypothetical protein [Euzebya sp.]|uniref:hypothetical protein n=1 Tax=Euzebya sp. TaxID=1971409 RepID=UPI003512015D
MPTRPPRRRLAVVDVDAGVGRGVALRVAAEADLEVVATTADARATAGVPLDAVVLSARRVDDAVLAALAKAARTHPGVPVVVVSLDDSAACPSEGSATAFVSMHDGDDALLAVLREVCDRRAGTPCGRC